MVLWVMMIFDAIVKKMLCFANLSSSMSPLIVVHEIEIIAKGLLVPVFITTVGHMIYVIRCRYN